jgi:putative oxidoreductase
MRFMERYTDVTYALFRIIAGLMFATHGAQKTLGLFGGQKMTEPLMVVAGWIELIGGLLIAFGLFTGIAAFICSGMMAVAYFMAHAPGGFWPVMNKGELAVLYCFAFLYMSSRGSGRFSIDALRTKQPGAKMRV